MWYELCVRWVYFNSHYHSRFGFFVSGERKIEVYVYKNRQNKWRWNNWRAKIQRNPIHFILLSKNTATTTYFWKQNIINIFLLKLHSIFSSSLVLSFSHFDSMSLLPLFCCCCCYFYPQIHFPLTFLSIVHSLCESFPSQNDPNRMAHTHTHLHQI